MYMSKEILFYLKRLAIIYFSNLVGVIHIIIILSSERSHMKRGEFWSCSGKRCDSSSLESPATIQRTKATAHCTLFFTMVADEMNMEWISLVPTNGFSETNSGYLLKDPIVLLLAT